MTQEEAVNRLLANGFEILLTPPDHSMGIWMRARDATIAVVGPNGGAVRIAYFQPASIELE